jgi:hypothetical protein
VWDYAWCMGRLCSWLLGSSSYSWTQSCSPAAMTEAAAVVSLVSEMQASHNAQQALAELQPCASASGSQKHAICILLQLSAGRLPLLERLVLVSCETCMCDTLVTYRVFICAHLSWPLLVSLLAGWSKTHHWWFSSGPLLSLPRLAKKIRVTNHVSCREAEAPRTFWEHTTLFGLLHLAVIAVIKISRLLVCPAGRQRLPVLERQLFGMPV